jgi:hypothetical protein
MILTGLGASTLAAIAATVGLLTVLLYILKLRRRPVSVPFSPLWQRVVADKESNQLFSQLKRWLSLLLQLVLIGLLVFALGDPRLSDKWFDGRSIVVLVDTSASMQSLDVAPTRLAVARKELSELVQGLSGSDRMLITDMGPTPRPRSPMTDDVATLSKAVEGLRATETRADFARALRFAADSLRGHTKPEIIVISDGALGMIDATPPLGDAKLSYIPIGSDDRNVAITQFSVRRYPLERGRYEVLLEVTNTNESPAEVEVTLLGDGVVVDVTTLRLGPSERLPRFYADLAGASRTLEAKLRRVDDAVDQLSTDDHAYALMPERRRIKVLLISAGNAYLEAALLLDEYLEVTPVKPDDALPPGNFDVTIMDGVAPSVDTRHGSLLYLNPPQTGAPVEWKKEKPITDFGFDTWDKQSPLLSFIAPENIQVTTGHALAPTDGDKVVGASEQGPILISGVRAGQHFVALGFDARNSDFVLRVAWPLFLLNCINVFAAEESGYLSSFRTGDVWQLPVPSDLETATLRTPAGESLTIPAKNGYAAHFGEFAGFYEVLGRDAKVVHSFAANLSNLEESTLTPAPELNLGGAKATAVEGFSKGVRRQLWIVLVIAGLALSLLEWFTYHRRVTV